VFELILFKIISLTHPISHNWQEYSRLMCMLQNKIVEPRKVNIYERRSSMKLLFSFRFPEKMSHVYNPCSVCEGVNHYRDTATDRKMKLDGTAVVQNANNKLTFYGT
jgi:hypothetical protein